MIPGSYEQILEMISKNTNLSVDEVERQIEAKRAKLSGLISKEGAAQIVASELGISFDKQKMKISELLTGMKKISIVGKIIKINRVIEYNKNGRQGKIGSFNLADDSANIRVVLWDTNHIELIEKGTIKEGDSVEIEGGDVRNGEIHLSAFAELKKTDVTFEKIQETPVTHEKNISEIVVNENVVLRSFIVQIFGPNFFFVCPECNKKVASENTCSEHGTVVPNKKAIVNFILDDGSSTIRCTLFDEQIRKLATDAELESSETFMAKRDELLGKEFIIEGNARKSNFSGETELIANALHEVNLDELVKKLEA